MKSRDNRLALVHGQSFKNCINDLRSYTEELQFMIKTLEKFGIKGDLQDVLIKHRKNVLDIVVRLINCKVQNEKDIALLLEAIYSTDDETAKDHFDFDIFIAREEVKH